MAGWSGGKVAPRLFSHQSSFIREDWIEQQLQRRVKEFTEEKKLTYGHCILHRSSIGLLYGCLTLLPLLLSAVCLWVHGT